MQAYDAPPAAATAAEAPLTPEGVRGGLLRWLAILVLASAACLALGHADPPLTARGRAQADAVAAALRDCGATRVLSSPLARARTTAEAIARELGVDVVVDRGRVMAQLHVVDRRADELGQLADAMNSMSAGLAERDRVRDLLDKNVSPEVAAQLLRDGATLGGQRCAALAHAVPRPCPSRAPPRSARRRRRSTARSTS